MKTLQISHPASGGPVHSVDVPMLGLGVFRMSDAEVEEAVSTALAAGYRHIDTAALYANEAAVGRAIAAAAVPRSQIHITTKLWRDARSTADVLNGFEASRAALGVAVVDLYLVHAPVAEGSREAVWRGMEQLLEQGSVRAIGVSNHGLHHLRELLAFAQIGPAVNQLELTPYLQRRELVAFCRAQGIALTAYSPLTKGEKLDAPELLQVSGRLRRTPAQILLRWGLEQGYIVIPKSKTPSRIRENGAIFDFALPEDVREQMAQWDDHLVTGWDPVREP